MILERTPQDRSAPSAAVKGLKLDCLRSPSGGLARSNASQEELRAAQVGARIEPSRSLTLNVRVVIVRKCLFAKRIGWHMWRE